MENTNNSNTTENTNVSEIDRAVAAAKARALAKAAAGQTSTPASENEPESKPRGKKLADAGEIARRDADRAAKAEARNVERLARKEAREAKKAERQADRKTPHFSKIEKAGASLPALTTNSQETYDLVCSAGLDQGEVTALIAHLGHYNRVRATEASFGVKFENGQRVQILSSDRDARLIGKFATITQVRKIRVLVDLEDTGKEAYLFLSDIVPAAAVQYDLESNPDSVPPQDAESVEVDESELGEGTFICADEDENEEEVDSSTGTEG
jgi:hypothetical protein